MLAKIIDNSRVGPDYYKIDFKPDAELKSISPGQFFHLQIKKDRYISEPLLRRPFSVFDYDDKNNILSIVYCIAGRGTSIMSRLSPGEKVDLLGPLGRGFKTDFNKDDLLVIGGGMGSAPLNYLLKELKGNNNLQIFLGGGTYDEINYFCTRCEESNLNVYSASMDGSKGYKGTVIDLLVKKNKEMLDDIDFVFSCGPEGLLKAVQKFAIKRNLSGQVSVEERMGCGFGVCLSCVCSTTDGNKRVCKEGPVFNIKDVVFDE